MASLPLSISMIALLSSPVALTVNFSGLTSSLTLSLMDCASSMMSLRLTAVIFTLALNCTFGVGTSSVEGSSVGVMNFRTILFFRVMLSFLFASSYTIPTDSSLLVLLSRFRRFDTLSLSLVGQVHSQMSKPAFGHSKPTIALSDGSWDRSSIHSYVLLNF